MNLHALRIFTMVASQKSVTVASQKFSISQPAVTIQIRNLEKELELKLIEPSGRGVKLTKAGAFLYHHAQYLFDMERDIEDKLVKIKNGDMETLRIASTYLPANFLLPIWLAKFKNIMPDVKVDLYSGNSQSVLDHLIHYKADIAFVVKEEWNQPELMISHLVDIDFWFIVPFQHKYNGKEVPLSVLVKEPFLLREEGSSTREILFSLCNVYGVAPPCIGLQFHGLNESIHSVIAGYGVMLAPALAVQQYIKNHEVGRVRVKGVDVKRPIYFCSRKKDTKLSLHEKKFLEIVKQYLTIPNFYE